MIIGPLKMYLKKLNVRFKPSGYRLLLGLLLSGALIPVFAGSKTDIIYLKNGDRVTGDIKELTQGQLRLSTDSFDTIFIKWIDISHINSNKWLQVELTDGTRFFGQMPEPEKAGDEWSLKTSRGKIDVNPSQVVRVEPISIEESFWSRLDGSVSIGFNYTQASDVAQFNLNTEATYRTRKYLNNLSFDANLTRKSEGNDTQRADLTATHLRFMEDRWFWFGSASAQTNEELGIDARALGSGGFGRYLLQTARADLRVALGLAANLEKSTSTVGTDSENDTSWEGVIAAEWRFYNLYMPKSNWRISALYYPGITETDRNRGNAAINFSQELFEDLFWNMNFYYSYDSKPPETALSKDDYGVTTSIGYSF
jgi:hypothetical protein